MRKYLNDQQEFPKSLEEIEGHVVAFEGHDRPRYAYPNNTEAGYLGLDDWGQYWNKAKFLEEVSGGKLDGEKYYSIIVVPVKADISVGGSPIYGEATPPSIPQLPTAERRGLKFTIPTHDQVVVSETGLSNNTENDSVTDESKEWVEDEYVGYFVKNVETGRSTEILSNTTDTLTCTGSIFSTGDRFQITSPAVTNRLVYAAEMSSASQVATANYYIAGVIDNNTDTTWTLNQFFVSSDIWDFSAGYLQPPNASAVKSVSGIMFCGGGIEESRGKAVYNGTVESRQATANADEEITISIEDELFEGANSQKVVRVTLGDELEDFNEIHEGSYVTINSSTNPLNDIVDARVTRADPDGRWVEFYNDDAEAGIAISATDPVFAGAGTGTLSVTATDDALSERWELICTGLDGDFIATNVVRAGGNVGTGILISPEPTENAVEETWTLTCTGVNKTHTASTPVADSENAGNGDVPYIRLADGYATEELWKLECIVETTNYSLGEITQPAGTGLVEVDIDSEDSVVEDWAIECTELGYGDSRVVDIIEGWTEFRNFIIESDAPVQSWEVLRYDYNDLYVKVDGVIVIPKTRHDSTVTYNGVTVSFDAPEGWGSAPSSFSITHDRNYVDTFTATGTVSGTPAVTPSEIISDGTDYSVGGLFDIRIDRGTTKWSLGDEIEFSITSARGDNADFEVSRRENTGEEWEAVDLFPSGIIYDGEWFSMTLPDGDLKWAEGDTITFETIEGNGDETVFSVSGTVSSTQSKTLTTGVKYEGNYFTTTLKDDAVNKWEEGDVVQFDLEASSGDGKIFSVTGERSGTQPPMVIGEDYYNNLFSGLSTQVGTAFALGDKFVFSTVRERSAVEDESMGILATPNTIGSSTFYPAIFSEGMKDAYFKFDADKESPFRVSWVDPIKNIIGLGRKYSGVVLNEAEFKVTSSYPLYYSDSKNPHRIRSGANIDIGDSITGLSSVGDNLLVFCKSSLWRIPIDSLGSHPVLISDNIRCPAQFSIVMGERFVAFYDGTGISVTDGVTAVSVTAYKAKDYLSDINKEYEANIRGVYDRENKRFEFVFPMGDEELNNYGLYLTEDSWNCYPFSRPDCNALWTNYYEGNLRVYHGTSGDLTSGDGDIWRHEGNVDSANAMETTIDSVSGQSLVVRADEEVTVAVGDAITLYPSVSGGTYMQAVVKSVEDIGEGAYWYRFGFADEYDISGFEAGDKVYIGYIPFDYGINWTDFASPQYRHQVRALHIDVKDLDGVLYVDHFKDMSDTVVATDEYESPIIDNKIVVPFRQGKCYKYGFRLRGLTKQKFKINSFEVMYDTQV